MMEIELIEKVAHLEERSKSNTRRIDEIEVEVKENRELTIAVKEIATEMKHLREEQANMNDRLKVIEEKPVKDYNKRKDKIIDKVIGIVVGIAMTYIAIKLGLGQYL